ncbi:MAG TPA: hypothetical protein VLZ50_00805 [Terracidiphilus sp.]|nr:hypothetical protein [Terracidiphilus sp.]
MFRPRWVLILATAVVSAPLLVAQSPEPQATSPVVSACVNNSNGAVFIVQSAKSCTKSQHFISWNIKGPVGPKGSQGPAGPQGAKGPTGTAATVAVGTTTTGEPGTNAEVTNAGTSSAAIFDFTIPQGEGGVKGAKLFTKPGQFTVPAGVASITVELIGGGGAGGGSDLSHYGSQGGSGAYTKDILAVRPGEVLQIFVGLGGAGQPDLVGGPGQDSTLSNPDSDEFDGASGGSGGKPRGGGGGAGGTASDGTALFSSPGNVGSYYSFGNADNKTKVPNGISFVPNGKLYGNGGYGAQDQSQTGGDGASGAVLIWW